MLFELLFHVETDRVSNQNKGPKPPSRFHIGEHEAKRGLEATRLLRWHHGTCGWRKYEKRREDLHRG